MSVFGMLPPGSSRIGTLDVLLALAELGAGLFNCVLIFYNFATRPARDSSVPYNLTQLALIWAEFIFQLILYPTHSLMSFRALRGPGAPPSNPKQFPWHLEQLGRCMNSRSTMLGFLSFNALSLLPLARPPRLLSLLRSMLIQARTADGRRSEGRPVHPLLVWSAMFVWSVEALFLACLAILALVFKLSQISFVGLGNASDWTGAQWLLLAGFINNVVSLTGQGKQEVTSFAEWVLFSSYFRAAPPVQQTPKLNPMAYLAGLIVQQHGWRGFLWMRGWSGEDLATLCIRDTAPDKPTVADPADSSAVGRTPIASPTAEV